MQLDQGPGFNRLSVLRRRHSTVVNFTELTKVQLLCRVLCF